MQQHRYICKWLMRCVFSRMSLRTVILTATTLLLLLTATTDAAAVYNSTSGRELCDDADVNSISCYNNGRCLQLENGTFTCQCITGYKGIHCQEHIACTLELENTMVLDPADSYAYDTSITYTCRDNFQFSEIQSENKVYKMARCAGEQTWLPAISECVALCPRVHTWRGYIVDTVNRRQGLTIRYTCWGKYPWYLTDAGKYQYKFENGNKGDDTEYSSSCQANGTWYPPIQECVEVSAQADAPLIMTSTGLLLVCGIIHFFV